MNKIFGVALSLWVIVVVVYLVNATTGLLIAEVTDVLRPLPLFMLVGFLAWYWPETQQRRLPLLMGMVLFALADASTRSPDNAALSMILYWCGFLAYALWAWQGVAMHHLRWILLIPVICTALLIGYWLWWVPELLREAMVAYNLTVLIMVMGVLLNSRIHWLAIPAALLLFISQAAMAMQTFLGGVADPAFWVMVPYYLGHLGLALGLLWYREPEISPFGYTVTQ